jgi:exonuclease VII small subunit
VEPGRVDLRHNVVLADITVIRALGAAHSRQAADLAAVAATLRSATPPSCAEAFGPVGARFVAALAEAVARESHAVAQLGERVAVAGTPPTPRPPHMAAASTAPGRRSPQPGRDGAGSLVSALVAPIRDVQALVGTGRRGSDDAAAVLAEVRDALADVSATGRRAWQQTGAEWSGAGADAAAEFSHATVAAVEELSIRVGHLGATAARAADAVARARARLQTIVEEFEARAAALEADLEEPGVAEALIDEARRALEEAHAVVDGLRAELDAQAAAAAPPVPAAGYARSHRARSRAIGLVGWVGAGFGSPSLGSPAWILWPRILRRGRPVRPGPWSTADAASRQGVVRPGVSRRGSVGATLPDGSTAKRRTPSPRAVRHASPNSACPTTGAVRRRVAWTAAGSRSGVSRSGLELPRLARSRTSAPIGRAPCGPGTWRCGMAHVAMIVGNGQMIEAGDPVSCRRSNHQRGSGFRVGGRPRERCSCHASANCMCLEAERCR